MQHELVSAQSQPALEFASKRCNRFFQERRIQSRQIDQIIRMNHQRLEVILLAQSAHPLALAAPKRIRSPLPRTGRKYLKSIAAEPISPLRRILHAARD